MSQDGHSSADGSLPPSSGGPGGALANINGDGSVSHARTLRHIAETRLELARQTDMHSPAIGEALAYLRKAVEIAIQKVDDVEVGPDGVDVKTLEQLIGSGNREARLAAAALLRHYREMAKIGQDASVVIDQSRHVHLPGSEGPEDAVVVVDAEWVGTALKAAGELAAGGEDDPEEDGGA